MAGARIDVFIPDSAADLFGNYVPRYHAWYFAEGGTSSGALALLRKSFGQTVGAAATLELEFSR